MMIEYLTLAFVLILSIIGHNSTVIYAAIIVLVLKIISQVSGQPFILEWMGSHGLNLGIIILTAAVLVPIADGTVTISTIINSFKSPIGIVAVIAGLLAAISGGVGVPLMQTNPNVIPALIVGTMAGVFFFKGIAVGPLIAAGFTYFVMSIIEHFK
ncbi:MAG: DUF441 domain-containing protein [Selenomonadaceae bacterium]|nr:DUF441 domain-containing protein [Selenomonadaceae bacterium]